MLCYPKCPQSGLDFPHIDHRDGLDESGNFIRRSFFVVVSAPSLQLFGSIFKPHEPVSVQTLLAEFAVERFDLCIVGGFART